MSSTSTTHQFARGHATRRDEAEQVNRQWHAHRKYRLPGGGGPTGWSRPTKEHDVMQLTWLTRQQSMSQWLKEMEMDTQESNVVKNEITTEDSQKRIFHRQQTAQGKNAIIFFSESNGCFESASNICLNGLPLLPGIDCIAPHEDLGGQHTLDWCGRPHTQRGGDAASLSYCWLALLALHLSRQVEGLTASGIPLQRTKANTILESVAIKTNVWRFYKQLLMLRGAP